VPLLGALGVATGAIAIGTVATLRSTTIIITIRTTISTATSAARDRVIGSTTRNTGEMHPMGTGKQRISTGAQLEAKVAGRRARQLERVPVAAVRELSEVVALELPIVPVAALEPVIDLAVVELGLPIGLAVAGVVKPTDLVAAELGLPIGPGVVLELELVQVAVALRTRSVTAAHRPDLVPLLEAEEDLVAVAETTREPVAAEAAIVWAAAGTAAAGAAADIVAAEVAVAAAAEAAEVAEGVADKQTID
jgi:hypothetical protein